MASVTVVSMPNAASRPAPRHGGMRAPLEAAFLLLPPGRLRAAQAIRAPTLNEADCPRAATAPEVATMSWGFDKHLPSSTPVQTSAGAWWPHPDNSDLLARNHYLADSNARHNRHVGCPTTVSKQDAHHPSPRDLASKTTTPAVTVVTGSPTEAANSTPYYPAAIFRQVAQTL